jgi:hypothetical protein
MSALAKSKGPSIGLQTLEDGEIVELSLSAYRRMNPTDIVRYALEQGVGARETAEVLLALGHGEFEVPAIVDARAILRAELADEYAITKPQAKALLLRRTDLVVGRLMHEFTLGKTGHARELRGFIELQSKLYGIEKNEDSLTQKLQDELDKVGAARVDVADIPTARSGHQQMVDDALAKHAKALIEEDE